MFVCLTGASGSGKSSIIKEILKIFDKKINILPSSTTRAIRPGEVEGQSYFYLSQKEFEDAISNNEFIEYQKVFANGNYYGVHKGRFNEYSKTYPILIKDVDVLGVQSIKNSGIDCVSIYIDIKDTEELKNRLILRGDNLEDIKIRLERKLYEDGFKNEYDYVVENNNLDQAVEEVKQIILTEAQKRNIKL